MDHDLIWRGMRDANPWWDTGKVPTARTRAFRRDAFAEIVHALDHAERGRGVVLLGPRRVGKSVLVHQVVDHLLARGAHAHSVVLLTLDDVALRGADLGTLLDLVSSRLPAHDGDGWLLLDEVQHSPEWAGWLKRIADRRDPWRFLATGSSATALRHGGQDAGVGRWREMTLYPWSFREHVRFRPRAAAHEVLEALDKLEDALGAPGLAAGAPLTLDRGVSSALDDLLVDYLVLGGFPEVLEHDDRREARRHLRQDILDRALGRDVVDVESVDTRALERMFLRICQHPGGLWNTSEVAVEVALSRPTVARYLDILERAFLAFSFPNVANPVKGQPKVYLVAPSLRAALLSIDEDRMREPTTWGPAAENLMAATLASLSDTATVGFWRKGQHEVDGVWLGASGAAELVEVKTGSPKGAGAALARAAEALRLDPELTLSTILVRASSPTEHEPANGVVVPMAQWLWSRQRGYGAAARAPV